MDGDLIFSQLYRGSETTKLEKLALAKILVRYKINLKTPYKGVVGSALSHAIKRGDAEGAELLLKHKADPHEFVSCEPFYGKRGQYDNIPLVIFSEVCGGTETTRLLLKHGADANACASNGMSIIPYYYHAVLQSGEYEHLKSRTKLLCKFGYDLNKKEADDKFTPRERIDFLLANKFSETIEGYTELKRDWDKAVKRFNQKMRKPKGSNCSLGKRGCIIFFLRGTFLIEGYYFRFGSVGSMGA